MAGFDSVTLRERREEGEGICSFIFSVPPESTYFKDHFESFRILPAVAEIDIAVNFASMILGKRPEVTEIRNAKLKKPIFPSKEIKCTLNLSEEGKMSFSFRSEKGTLLSEGSMEYAV